jgi:PAS domain S-box-containing protein
MCYDAPGGKTVARQVGTCSDDVGSQASGAPSAPAVGDILKCIFDASPLPMLLARTGRVLAVNRAALALHGCSDEGEVVGCEFLEHVHPDDRERLRRFVADSHAGRLRPIPLRTPHKDGSFVEVEAWSHAVQTPGGPVQLVVLRQPPRPPRAKEAPEAADGRLAALVRSTHDVVWFEDAEGAIELVNPAFEYAVGRHSDDIAGRKVADVFPAEVASRHEEAMRLVGESGAPLSYAVQDAHPDGRRFVYETVKAPVLDGSGRLAGFVTVSREVSALERAETGHTLARCGAVVSLMAEGLALQYGRIRKGLLAEAGRASRDLRAGDGEAARLIESAAGLTADLASLVGGGEARRKPLPLAEAAGAALAMARPVLERDGIRVEESLSPDTPRVTGDRAELMRMVLGLVVNAREAVLGREERKVAVRTGRRGLRAFVEVEDSGGGIAQESVERVYAPFLQGMPGWHEEEARIGEGLVAARRAAFGHSGAVEVSSSPGKGTTFTALLPVRPPTDALVRRVGDRPLGGLRVLVVEDDPAARAQGARTMARAGAEVKEAATARQAAALVERERFDAVVLDLILPGASGEAVLEAVGRLQAARRPAVVILTGLWEPGKYRELGERGAAAVLYKPRVSPGELVAEVVQAVAASRANGRAGREGRRQGKAE